MNRRLEPYLSGCRSNQAVGALEEQMGWRRIRLEGSSKRTYTVFLNEDTSEGGHMQAVQRAKPTQVVKALFVDLATAVPRPPGKRWWSFSLEEAAGLARDWLVSGAPFPIAR